MSCLPMESSARPLHATVRAMARGLALRCPSCSEGRMGRSLFGIGGMCAACGQPFELGAGDFSGAIMIAQMLLGLAAIPVWILFTILTTLSFTATVVWTFIVLFALLILFYRNIKGMWYGFLISADSVQQGAGARR